MDKRLKILVVGALGKIGRAIAAELNARHDIIRAGRTSGDLHLDISDVDSMRAAFTKLGPVDAVIAAAGEAAFVPLGEISAQLLGDSAYTKGITHKLMGQVNLALMARSYLSEQGSITLTSGILAEYPVAGGSSASMVNGALEAFVRTAAVEMPHGMRINIVSPNLLIESQEIYAPYFRGIEPVPAARVAKAYSRSVEGWQTGQVYRVH